MGPYTGQKAKAAIAVSWLDSLSGPAFDWLAETNYYLNA